MTKVELVARVLAVSRSGKADRWAECCADALLVLAACGISGAFPPASGFAQASPAVANDP